jgi:hypothetical protein
VRKPKLVCPFSRKACKECGIFRGRHLGLCYFPAYQGRIANKEEILATGQVIEKPKPAQSSTKFELPDIPESSTRMVNIEDFIERRGR